MQKLLTFFQQNISMYAIFNFNDTLTSDIICIEKLGAGKQKIMITLDFFASKHNDFENKVWLKTC